MDPATLVEETHAVIEKLRLERGDFILAMLVSSSTSGSSDWNVIVSAVWLDELGKYDGIPVLTHALRKGLSRENQSRIGRVTVLQTNDPFVMEVTSFYLVASPGARTFITSAFFGGVEIPRAMSFYSQRTAPAVTSS